MTVRIKPHSVETKLIIEPDGEITLHVAAPPLQGKANKEIVKWLAKKFGKSSSQVRLIAGLHSKTKIIEILDVNRAEVEKILGIGVNPPGGANRA
jgi:uncharacterized protein (TIGR00251 family)